MLYDTITSSSFYSLGNLCSFFLGEVLVWLSLFWREPLLDQIHSREWKELMHCL